MSRWLLFVTSLSLLMSYGLICHAQTSLSSPSVDIVSIIENGQTTFVVVITEADGSKRGYRNTCGVKLNSLAKAFGFLKLTDTTPNKVEPGTTEYDNLRLDEQPTLHCDRSTQTPKGDLFAVYNPPSNEPRRYYMKFPGRPNEIYALHCKNQLEFFGFTVEQAIPITHESLSELIPQRPNKQAPRELPCYPDDGAADALPASPDRVNTVDLGRPKANDVSVYKATNTGNWTTIKATAHPIVISGKVGFAVDCGSKASSLFAALGLKDKPADLRPISEKMYKESPPEAQPILSCMDTQNQPRISKVYNVINDKSQSVYVRFHGHDQSLVRFGCPQLRKFFNVDNVDPKKAIGITAQSLPFLTFPENADTPRRVDLNCAGPDPDMVARAFLQVFGVQAQPEWIQSETEKMNQLNIAADTHSIVTYFVERAYTESEIRSIVQGAFSKVFSRKPDDREAQMLETWILKKKEKSGKTLRPHLDELVTQLHSIYCQKFSGPDCAPAGFCIHGRAEILDDGVQITPTVLLRGDFDGDGKRDSVCKDIRWHESNGKRSFMWLRLDNGKPQDDYVVEDVWCTHDSSRISTERVGARDELRCRDSKGNVWRRSALP